VRALSNRWVGILHGCLRHHNPYDEATALGHRNDQRLGNPSLRDPQHSRIPEHHRTGGTGCGA
jgi:hypothetical protein